MYSLFSLTGPRLILIINLNNAFEGYKLTKRPLTDFKDGTVVRVADIDGGRKARSRMLAMGLTPGCPVEILSGGPTGCRVRVRGSEVVLCCGLAGKILAVENDSNEVPPCNCCPSERKHC